MQKRMLTIQDYSCLGRCSLTVALPTISACGIEAVGIPTAILSNHTQYESWTFTDLTSDIEPIVNKWDNYNNNFDCIYTGYLATHQIEIVKNVIKKLKRGDTLVYIDPAMADNGALYKGFSMEHVEKMKELISIADYIKPNVTEAIFLTGENFSNIDTRPLSFYAELAKKLSKLGAKNIILTGIKLDKQTITTLVYSSKEDSYFTFSNPYLEVYFHGTGDLFSSALSSCLTLNIDIKKSLEIAHRYVVESMEVSLKEKSDGLLYGPAFETKLSLLNKLIEEAK